MTQNHNKAGRKPKIDTTVFRCSVNFTASEQAMLMAMYDRVQVESMSAFIKMVLFEKPFKVFYVDENTRIFIDKLSSLNSLYRTVGVEYVRGEKRCVSGRDERGLGDRFGGQGVGRGLVEGGGKTKRFAGVKGF